jgi:hypothetical protein
MPKFFKNNLKFLVFNKLNLDKYHNDELIVKFIKAYRRPAPPCLISLVCGLSRSKTSQVLKSLTKHKILKIVYRRRVPFYYFNDGYGGK